MNLVLDPAAKSEMREAAFFYEGDIVFVAAVMHMKRRPEYWQKRIIDK
jgi:hypothetical protein